LETDTVQNAVDLINILKAENEKLDATIDKLRGQIASDGARYDNLYERWRKTVILLEESELDAAFLRCKLDATPNEM
jgi:hypothetical protein